MWALSECIHVDFNTEGEPLWWVFMFSHLVLRIILEGTGPRILSIMAKCSLLSWVWKKCELDNLDSAAERTRQKGWLIQKIIRVYLLLILLLHTVRAHKWRQGLIPTRLTTGSTNCCCVSHLCVWQNTGPHLSSISEWDVSPYLLFISYGIGGNLLAAVGCCCTWNKVKPR